MEIGNITRLLKEKKEFLKKGEEVVIVGGSMNRVLGLKKEINDLLSKEEKNVETEIPSFVVT